MFGAIALLCLLLGNIAMNIVRAADRQQRGAAISAVLGWGLATFYYCYLEF